MHRPAVLALGAPYNMVSRCNIGYQLARGSFQGLDLIIVAGIGPVATDNLQTITARPCSSFPSSLSLGLTPPLLPHALPLTRVSVDETIEREIYDFALPQRENNESTCREERTACYL